jgi:hypothetical protein
MPNATGEAIRTPARMEPENVRDQHLDTGGRIVSSAFRLLGRVKIARGAAVWLAGFEAGVSGDNYVYPAGVRDRLAWASGFIEGKAQRDRAAP